MYRTRLSAPRSALRLAVDPISNAIAISVANPAYPPKQPNAILKSPGTWGAALAEGVLADDLLWPIIHEFTHHSSLNTAVGASLAALAVSHTSVVGAQFDEEKFSWVAKDAVRHALIERLLRPVLEGLALFAEFDAISGKVPVASWSQQTAATLFCMNDLHAAVLRGDDPLAPLKQKLETLRMSPLIVSKKKALLSRSIFDQDGYLLGYMLVKMIWNDLVARAPLWNHSDIFQAFLSDYFFNDFHLAKLLVPMPSEFVQDELEQLPNYLHNRVVLLSKDFAPFAQQFLLWFHNRSNPRPSYQSFSEAGHKELEFLWTARTLRSLHFHTPDFQTTRGIPRVLVAPATVRISEEGGFEAVFDDGFPPMRGPALEAGRPSDGSATVGDGSVEAVILLPENGRRSPRLFLCVLLDKDLVATFDPLTGEFNDPDAAEACDKLASYLALESFCEMVEGERLFRAGSETQRLVDALRGEEGLRRMLDLWLPFAVIPNPEEADRPESPKRFANSGLKGALSLTDSQMRLLTRVSLLPVDQGSSLQPNISSEELLELDQLNSKSMQVLGFRLLNLDGQHLLPSRI